MVALLAVTQHFFLARRHEVPDFELTKPPTASLVQGADQKQLTTQRPQQHQ
jgi:hypothetical protein